MKYIYGYHITNMANLKSILRNGLVPSIGKNSRYVGETKMHTYFTMTSEIELWRKRLNLEKSEAVVLKFQCCDYIEKNNYATQYYISNIINSKNICVMTDNEISLDSYYDMNKEMLKLKEEQQMLESIKVVLTRIVQINKNDLTPERSLTYNETEPDIIETIELLKKVRDYSEKNKYVGIINEIRNYTLSKLLENDLDITYDSKIYQILNMIFDDCLSDKPNIDILSINYLIVLLKIDLIYRQFERLCRTDKKYKRDDCRWTIDNVELDKIKKLFSANDKLMELFDELENLEKRHIKLIR